MSEQIKIDKISDKGFKFELLKQGEKVARARLYVLHNDLHKMPFGFMEDVFVKEDFRGQGYGTRIVKALIEKAKTEKCYKLIGNSRLSKEKVHHFYEKLGFERHGYEFRMDFE